MRNALLSLVALLLLLAKSHAQTHEGVELVKPQLLADTQVIVPGQPFEASLHLRIAPHWHTYWRNPGDAGMATKIEWELPPGFAASAIRWPIPEKKTEEGDLQTYAYDDETLLFVTITPPVNLPEKEVILKAKARWLVCEKICIPGGADLALKLAVGQKAKPANKELFAQFQAHLPETSALPFKLAWQSAPGALALNITGLRAGQKADFFPIPPPEVVLGHPEAAENEIKIPLQSGFPAKLPGLLVISEGDQRLAWEIENEPASSAAGSAAPKSLAWFLLLGFAGGFILNLMPCVLPVIALKIFGFIKQAHESAARIWALGLMFVGGIFAWFLVLAVLVSGFKLAGRELNWAFQFQSPLFLAVMFVIVLVFALSLLGFFEIFLPSRSQTAIAGLSGREGYGGAFWHGVFATLMATPCTAPFLGPALGFAFAQSTIVIFTIFAAIAAGMSLPYLVLSARPAWLKFLPKPGMWMVRVKQAMGVLLLGTCVWLGWIWWQVRIEREPFAPKLDQALAGDRPVFVDFTADWCVNCKANERLVLRTPEVQAAFAKANVHFLEADWTRGDADITKLLRSFGRAGVPLYVFYPADRAQKPVVLPELITKQMVIDAVEKSAPAQLTAR